MYNPEIVSRIWRGFGSIDIVKDLAPGTDREERDLFDAITQTRAAIEKLRRDLPPIIEEALRKGFSQQEVVNGILKDSEGLIPRFNAECLVAGVQAKLDKENQVTRDAAEKAASEERLAVIRKRIDDAKADLRKMGAPV